LEKRKKRKVKVKILWAKLTTYGGDAYRHHINFGPKLSHMTIFESM
jgi:hypothetical protein